MNEEELSKITLEYADICAKHGLYSHKGTEFIKQYEDDIVVYDNLRFVRQLLKTVRELLSGKVGEIEDKVLYYEDTKELGLEDNI